MKLSYHLLPRALRALVPCLAVSAASPGGAAPNLLQNGGFELGQAPGTVIIENTYGAWSAPNAYGGFTGLVGLPYGMPPLEGQNALILVAVSSVSQTIATTPGRKYRLSYYVNASAPGEDLGTPAAATGTVRVYPQGSAGAAVSGAITVTAEGVWTPREVSFTATGARTTLEFQRLTGGNLALDDVRLQAELPAEATVFGTGDRPALSDPAIQTDEVFGSTTKLVGTTLLNNESRTVNQAAEITAGTMTIVKTPAPNSESIFDRYHNGTSTLSLELIAETVVIKSAWVLPQTQLTIRARELRFEGEGSITTTGAPHLLPAAPNDGLQRGGDGKPGAPGGDIRIFVEKYTDATLRPGSKLILKGANGQDAGKGAHGKAGKSIPVLPGPYTVSGPFFGEDTFTPPAGWSVQGWLDVEGGERPVTKGNVTEWPGNGTDAIPSGTPGIGGNGGRLTTNKVEITGQYEGGSAGQTGKPDPKAGQSSLTQCVGGPPGTPVHSMVIETDPNTGFGDIEIREKFRNTSIGGKSYPVPTNVPGQNGSRVTVVDPYAWVSPQLVRQVLNTAKDQYLQNDLPAAAARLNDYVAVLEAFQTHSSWTTKPATLTQPEFDISRAELSQMRDEMRLLLLQIANGQDYFGNPAGWVPMLSFEVASSIFNSEIDRSLNTIYLARWIGKKQNNAADARAGLATARNQLAEEIKTAQETYSKAYDSLPSLNATAEDLQGRIETLQATLKGKLNALHAKAEENTKPSGWETAARASLKIASMACKMIPAYQPALGTAGDVLELGSDFDPDKPLDTLAGGVDIAAGYLETTMEDEASAQKDQIEASKLTPEELAAMKTPDAVAKAKRATKLKNMATASKAFSGGVKSLSGIMDSTKVPAEEIDAELEKLKAADPEYLKLVEDIQALLTEKRDFADRIASAVQDLAGSSDLVTRNIVAMDALSNELSLRENIIDSNAASHLKDMERRAWDRLLKYHYYMAKAYEFRLVRRYEAKLNLQNLYTKFSDIADQGAPAGSLTTEQHNALKTIFTNLIANTTETIYTDFQNSAPTQGTSFNYTLPAADLAKLNSGQDLTLNLFERGLFPSARENLRIADIRVAGTGGISTSIAGGVYGNPVSMDLSIQHSGLSNLKLDGKVHQFRHYNKNTRDLITWLSSYDPSDNGGAGGLNLPPLVSSGGSLLRSLLPPGSPAASGILLYSRPAAWADLTLWRSGINGATQFERGDAAPIALTKVVLKVEYDYTNRLSTNPVKRTLQVVTAKPANREAVVSSTDENNALTPYFTVSNQDLNNRQDGEGRFLRIYNSGAPASVTVTAPALYGDLEFWKWRDGDTDAGTNPTITVSTSADHRLVACYTVAVIPTIVSNVNDSGPGSLRQILSGVPRGAVISFAPALSGQTIQLASDLSVNKLVTIDAGALPGGITIAGGASSRVFTILEEGNLLLRGLTVTGGNAFYGGGLDNNGSLRLERCTITGNNAAADGGGISNAAGAVFVAVNSTITGNTAQSGGGGLANRGGALLGNVTIAGNSASNGGGVACLASGGSMLIGNSIVAGNTATAGANADIDKMEGSVTPVGPCFIGNNASVASIFPAGPLAGTAAAPRLAQLNPLADNGGPTRTMILRAGSPALNAGTTDLSTDQRGFPRLLGPAPDLGAVEGAAAAVLPTVSNTADTGAGSLRLALANAVAGDRIVFAPGLANQTILLASPLTVDKMVTIDSAGLPGVILKGSGNGRVITVAAGGDLTLRGLTVTGGSDNHGGGIYSDGILAVDQCDIVGNSAAGDGGGILVGGGSTVTITNSTITGNTTGEYGGGVANTGSLRMEHVTITGNSAKDSGGVDCYWGSGQLRVGNCIIAGNTAREGSLTDFGKVDGTVTPTGPNFVGNNTSVEAAFPAGALVGTAAAPRSAGLSSLANNGGPTMSILPLSGSPVIDAGAVIAGITTDQRGMARSLGTAPDLGAAESAFFAPNAEFRISAMVPNLSASPPSLTVTWGSRPGASYILQSSVNLQDWIQVGDPVRADAASTTRVVPLPLGTGRGYVRVKADE